MITLKLYKNLATALKEASQVEALKVSLPGPGFPGELLMLPNLRELYLEGGVESFPRIGYPWEKLRVLSIKWSKFSGDISGLFALSIENLKIIETPIPRLHLPLGQLGTTLRHLTIKDCGMKELPEEISMLTGLEEMNLSGNLLEELPKSLKLLPRLRRLNLDGNRFKKFPDSISTMKSLSHVSLDGNLFSEEEKARIQREFNLWLN